jgi:hypothetical protein
MNKKEALEAFKADDRIVRKGVADLMHIFARTMHTDHLSLSLATFAIEMARNCDKTEAHLHELVKFVYKDGP